MSEYNNQIVSVIVTTFNRKTLLKETIDSILIQSFRDFELIVVDNYSDYDFFDLIKSFNDVRIRPFQNHNYGIIALNRNFGISKAKAKYIAFCDDDDIWLKEKLELQVEFLEINPDAILVSTNYISNGKYNMLSEFGLFKELKFHFISLISNKKIYLSFMNFFALSSILIRNKEGLNFSEDPELIGSEDFNLYLELSFLKDRLEIINKKLIKYRIHPSSVTSNQRKKFVIKFITILNKNRNKLTSFQLILFMTRKLIFRLFNI